MTSLCSLEERPATQSAAGLLLDHTVLTFALSEFIRTGILADLAARGSITKAELGVRYPDDCRFLSKAASLLCEAGVIEEEPSGYVKGPAFADYWRYAGTIHWLIHGNSRLLLDGPRMAARSRDGLRDYRAIAQSSKLAGEHLIDPYLAPVWAKLSPAKVADIGCGSAHRLISLLNQFPLLKALGIDRSMEAVTIARENAATQGVSARIEFVHADILEVCMPYPDVAMVFSALMAHDLGSSGNAIEGFQHLRTIFPNASTMFIVDTCRFDQKGGDRTFIDSFEYVHSLLGIGLASAAEWTDIFKAAGWELQELVATGLPNTFGFLLRRAK